jgi:IS30 family transposase
VRYLWDESSGNRKYTKAEHESFFALLDRLGNVTAAGAELGINHNVGYLWVRNAGIGGAKPHPGREEYFRLRAEGIQGGEAARRTGVHIRTAVDWDKGIRKSNSKRTYPDGRVINYRNSVRHKLSAETSVSMSVLDKPIDTRYLCLPEREMIRGLAATGASLRTIVGVLSRSPSTVSREIARNRAPERDYQPYAAHRTAAARRPRPKERKLVTRPMLRDYVEGKLRMRWSPEQISKTLIKEYPDDQEMRVTHETIYQALYLQGRGGLRRELATALRTGRARRKTHCTGAERRPRFVDAMVMISERPAEIEDRAVPGHWEGDLITGAYNQSAIGTLVERTTRYVMLVCRLTTPPKQSATDS